MKHRTRLVHFPKVAVILFCIMLLTINYTTVYANVDVHVLVAAAEGGLLVEVNKALKEGVDVNGRDYTGNTALCVATEFGHTDIVKVLLKHGATPDATSVGGSTPLMFAASNGILEAAELLISGGANVNFIDRKGETALMRASADGHLEIARLLISKGAKIDVADQARATALLKAANNGHLEIAGLLLENHANVNIRDRNWRTPLLDAASDGNIAMMRLLLSKGADVNSADKAEGATALIMIMRHKRASFIDIANVLVENGADVNAQGRDGYTALHAAAIAGNNVAVKFLLDHGADPYIEGMNGRIPYLVALSRGHRDTAELIQKWMSNHRK
ncbi:MAG: ankyrin repeat domain-containing protein [Desulfomonilaceae bacterium]